MTASEDEYDAQLGGPIELTPEECDRIDAICATHAPRLSIHRHQHVEIAIEEEDKPILDSRFNDEEMCQFVQLPSPVKYNPYDLFRRARGRLSVTDIVAPSWCEFQFEYGLAQQRWKRPKDRPSSFVTRRGKVITTDHKTAEVKEKVLDGGKAIHQALELEIHAPQRRVYVSLKEEEWGLKLFNMLGYVESLLTIGKCREFPVVGFIHNRLVTGIIDEICYLPIRETEADVSDLTSPKRSPIFATFSPPRPQPSKRYRSNGKKAHANANQTTLENFFPVTPTKKTRINDTSKASIERVAPRKEPHSLHLVDSKTRMSLSLPDYSETHSSRMQLMLYKRLLDSLTSLTPPFEFDRLWRELGLNSDRYFSRSFLRQVYPEGVNKNSARCLRDFEKQWRAAVETLGINEKRGRHSKPVHDELVLAYRRRPGNLKKSVSSPKVEPSGRRASSEDPLLQQALMESLGGLSSHGEPTELSSVEVSKPVVLKPDSEALDPDTLEDEEIQLTQSSLNDSSDPVLQATILESFETERRKDQPVEQESCNNILMEEEEPEISIGGIIGEFRFQHDDEALDDYVTDIFKWWHGERDPTGVSMQDVYRCHTCEYMSGCEWREDKALEVLQQREKSPS